MLYYPKIPDTRGCPGGPCIAFDKLDGTNVHFDWAPDFGFHAFGTRRDVFNLDDAGIKLFEEVHPGLEGAHLPFLAIAERLDAHFRATQEQADHEARAFCEVFTRGSFAGEHPPGPKELVLFDVEREGKLVPPAVFVKEYAAYPLPRVIYRGVFSGRLVEDVRTGAFDVDEGVVIKGTKVDPMHGAWMAKVKTDAYIARLKAVHGARWTDYGETDDGFVWPRGPYATGERKAGP